MGVVRVSIKPLIAALKPEPRRCIKVIHALVPRLANRKHEAFMSDVTAANSRLRMQPETLPELAEHVNFVADVTTRGPVLDAAFEEVEEYYSLCKVRTAPTCASFHQQNLAFRRNLLCAGLLSLVP